VRIHFLFLPPGSDESGDGLMDASAGFVLQLTADEVASYPDQPRRMCVMSEPELRGKVKQIYQADSVFGVHHADRGCACMSAMVLAR
jgi:hypothetical protein